MNRNRKTNAGCNNPAFRHGHCKRSGQSSEYMTWCQMIQRCKNPKNRAFHDYGMRGIKVCERWMDFSNFLADMGPRPPGLTLERVDNQKGYSPDNCTWSSRSKNNNNKRNNIVLTMDGVSATAAQWSKMGKVPYRAFVKRLRRGWTLKKAIETPSLYMAGRPS